MVYGYDYPSSDRNMKRNRDEAQMSKLQQLGMNSTEEAKLMAMRDYILKLARAISRKASRVIIIISHSRRLPPGAN